ncbi:MAG: PocR ligand-binding domain-containing protein [Lachnospiraceae bacterium]|nr:PocR ligand-binding domain-containing protein [Lachnospiraceae bacterium]
MTSEVKLTDYIDKDILQKIQDSFSDMTGLAALTTNADGSAVTEGSNFCRFCTELNRGCPLGKQLCEYSDKTGAMMTHSMGKPTFYTCHAGLVDFSAPIIINGEMIGCFVGGQALTSEPEEPKVKAHALQLGLDPDEYWKAICEVPVISEDKVGKAMDFLYTISGVLSDIAYGKYTSDRAKVEMEHAVKMKSDFLANMSHEIRTPMNAVIGMAEMALREDIPDNARSYINQIKSSGRALLTIINDILDFSKIESGKMDISPVEYEPMSLFNDVANIIMTRLMDKEIELILNMNVDMPHLIYGDNVRIRQILINLANNAVKFTRSGQVRFVVDFTWIDSDNIMLSVAVEDTGIGIKPENVGKIFESFSQLDSKRNRDVEGSGLGLAISKNLLNLMNGTIHVESEYGRGSVFSFKLPQKVVDKTPSMSVKNPSGVLAIGLFENIYLSDGFTWDAAKLGVSVMNLALDADLPMACDTFRKRNPGRKLFVFIEQELLTEEKKAYFRQNPDICAVSVVGFFDRIESDLSNLLVVKKPLSAMNMAMILNHEKVNYTVTEEHADEVTFTAPEAKVLIVDDNSVNLTVSEGLLEPLKMKTATAISGKEAIRKIEETHFDLILMDHMMPEMDGVETTRIIRRMYPDYDNVPIIALTANAVNGVKEMFLSEGMNDFVAKPIELRVLVGKIRQWLPPDLIVKGGSPPKENDTEKDASDEEVISVSGVLADLDTEEAMRLLGTEKLFNAVLAEYTRTIPEKVERLEKLYRTRKWADYAIEVHGLKNASRQIGAMELSSVCAELEKAARSGSEETIMQIHDGMIERYRAYEPVLKAYLAEHGT